MPNSRLEQTIGRMAQYNDPQRFAQIEQLHTNAFSWRKQDHIPLGIHVVNPQHSKGLSYPDIWLKPEILLEVQAKQFVDTLEVGSDLLPVIGINHFGDVVPPSLFGAKRHMPDGINANLHDIGPTSLAVFSDIRQVENIAEVSLDGGLMPEVECFAQFYRENLPDWVNIVGPMPSGPFSMAMELRGSSILVDLVDEPALCKKLMRLCAQAAVGIEKRFRQIARTSPKYYTNFGVVGTGLRLGEDSICNLSPAMIAEFGTGLFQQINQAYGGKGHIHFCSLPHSRFDHIYPTLRDMPEVAVVSSQFGFEYYQEHLEELRGKLAVEAFYGDAYRYVVDKHGSFQAWANEFVPRFKNESGLVLYMNVSSVDEGKRVWQAWQRAHQC